MKALLLLAAVALATASTDKMNKYHKRTSQKFLDEKEKEEGVHKLPSGMLFKVLEKGTKEGRKSPTVSDSCEVHYEGRLRTGKVFDSSYSRGQPATFAPNQVIKGWTEALQYMMEGDKWQLYIPYDMAYGERGSPPNIPGFSTLVFDVELIKVQQGGKSVEDAKKLLKGAYGKDHDDL